MTLSETLEEAFKSANLQPQDQAAAELARIYARTVDIALQKRDSSKTISDIGSKLLAVLKDLGMTPAGRAVKEQIKGGGTSDADSAAFEQLRASFSQG